jgi:hypothetical protein
LSRSHSFNADGLDVRQTQPSIPAPKGYWQSSDNFLDWTYVPARRDISLYDSFTMTFRSGYSAKVALTLKVGDREIALSHVGPNEVSLRELCERVDPSDAQVVIQVDEISDVMDVYLPNGIPSDSHEVAYI